MTEAWQRLWAPHRIEYIKAGAAPHIEDCPFCRVPSESDESGLIVYRGETAFVVMNLFPYNTGHILICPYRHFGSYTDATESEVAEIGALTQHVMKLLKHVSGAQGFNIGMNQGNLAGAGIAEHLHQHVVPRWTGDANFMPVIGGTKVLPQLLEDTRALLAHGWNDV
jgi:ATP adenylyltransferase